MKKIFSNMMILAALLTAGAAMTACSNDETAINEQPVMKTYEMNINASKSNDAMTRALGWDGSKLISTWTASTDKVKVYLPGKGSNTYAGELTAQSSGVTTTLTGTWTIATPPDVGDWLLLAYPKSSITYAGQVGTLEDISDNFDYAEAITEVKASKVDGEISTDDAVFYNRQSVVKFTLVDKATSNSINATSLTVSFKDASNDDVLITAYDYPTDTETYGEVTINTSAKSEIWAALSNALALGVSELDDVDPVTVTLTATVGSDTYKCEQAGVVFRNGKYYTITANMTKQAAPSYKMAADAVAGTDKGKLICTDGHIHVYGEDAACTAGRVAKIIYVGTTGHATYNHGLALALEDMSTTLTWDNSGANNDGKTAAEWCSAWNTSKPVTDAEWLLASKDQWDYMLGTNGAGSYTDLRDGFDPSVGGTNMKKGHYWSSTEDGTDNAWDYYFGNFGGGDWFSSDKDYNNYNVRACLAF